MQTPRRPNSPSYYFDDVMVDLENFRILKDDEPRPLEPRAFNLLVYLIENRGRVVEKQELFDQIWKDSFVTDNALPRAIKEIRRAIGDDAASPRHIETIPKRGYRFVAELKPGTPSATGWEERAEALNYKIVRKLDEGGGGVVYLARDIRLQGIIARAMRKDPGERYQTTPQLLQDLKELKQDSQSGGAAIRKAVARRALPLRAIAYAASALVLLAGIGLVLKRIVSPSSTRPVISSLVVSRPHKPLTNCSPFQKNTTSPLIGWLRLMPVFTTWIRHSNGWTRHSRRGSAR